MKPLRPPRKVRKGSVRWFQSEWRRILSVESAEILIEDLAIALGQLSYENSRLRVRLSQLEDDFHEIGAAIRASHMNTAIYTSQIKRDLTDIGYLKPRGANPKRLRYTGPSRRDDMVMVGSTPHLHECELAQKKLLHKVVDNSTPCTCGSEGTRERTERLRRSN